MHSWSVLHKFLNHHCYMCAMQIRWDIALSLNRLPRKYPDMHHVLPSASPFSQNPNPSAINLHQHGRLHPLSKTQCLSIETITVSLFLPETSKFVGTHRQIMAEINQGKTMTSHDWPRIFVSYLQVHRDGSSGARVTTDWSLPLPGAKQAENVAARQPSILCVRSFFYYLFVLNK